MTKEELRKSSRKKDLECYVCNTIWVVVSSDVSRVMCHRCVALMVGPPEELNRPEPTGYQRGWHLRKLFISEDGKYFNRGTEITKKEAEMLDQVPDITPTKKSKKTAEKKKVPKKRQTKPKKATKKKPVKSRVTKKRRSTKD